MTALKVYELINILEKIPAGATVEINSVVGLEELQHFPHVEGDEFSYSAHIHEVEYDENSNTANLYV